MLSLICAWINGWVNNRKAGELRRQFLDFNECLDISKDQLHIHVVLSQQWKPALVNDFSLDGLMWICFWYIYYIITLNLYFLWITYNMYTRFHIDSLSYSGQVQLNWFVSYSAFHLQLTNGITVRPGSACIFLFWYSCFRIVSYISKLPQAMLFCLVARSHYLNHCLYFEAYLMCGKSYHTQIPFITTQSMAVWLRLEPLCEKGQACNLIYCLTRAQTLNTYFYCPSMCIS